MSRIIILLSLIVTGCCQDPKNLKVVAVGGCDSSGHCKATLEDGQVVRLHQPVAGLTVRMCAGDIKSVF